MCNTLHMRSKGDLTGAALIREAAMRLFAEHGFSAVSVRDIAAEAGVSPSLVIHHYGSKEQLKEAVDLHATSTVAALLEHLAEAGPEDLTPVSMAALFSDELGDGTAVPAYLRRLLAEGNDAATTVFRELFGASQMMMTKLERAGLAKPSPDPAVRTAFLLANDLAVILLRTQIAAVLDVDPFSREGLLRWSHAVMEVYGGGVFQLPEKGESA